MSTTARLLGFLLVLGAVLAVALGAGRAFGPLGEPEPVAMGHAAEAGHEDTGHGDTHSTDEVDLPSGLSSTEDGYTLRLERSRVPAGAASVVRFVIEGPDGAPVTTYDVAHGKRLHLIAVRRDLTGYQHVHPTLAADGTWSARLALSAGVWRLFADTNPTGGTGMTLGTDLVVAGKFEPRGEPPETRTDRVGVYTVTVEGGLDAGHASELTLTVHRDGRPVTDLQPYLGAYGHLVALREGDLAYLHVHPEGSPLDGRTQPGPEIGFVAEVPSAARYRLFLDFKHGGKVRTAELVLAAETER